MNLDIKFKSLEELYKRLIPALKSKTRELNKKGLTYIHEEDIWNFLKNYTWVNSRNLDLGMMVNDIFEINEHELDSYVREEIRKYRREMDKEEI